MSCVLVAVACGDDDDERAVDSGTGPGEDPDSGIACVGPACDRPDADDGRDVLSPPPDGCGNGMLEDGEGCDDGNTDSGDGCSSECALEATCGNGTTDPGEGCDDGNLDRGDGCSPSCALEASCGDGRMDAGEECDDGGGNSDTAADACRTDCRRAHCGDAVTDDGEACDDGDRNSDTAADACRTTCERASCGDGARDTSEACDTGDARSDTTPDACRTGCALPRCGDAVRDTGEACDDGNTDDGDACRTSCTLASCGDGRTDAGEACDDGNTTSGDGCQANCLLPACGDSVVDEGEECDDGNVIDGDGCQDDCTESDCATDADCDDGAFCNGTEACVAGVCAPGSAPSLDDGVACTIDTCDEDTDAVVHRPSDGVCVAFEVAPSCATSGPNAGRLVRTAGVCDSRADCTGVVLVVDDCLDDARYPTTYSCGTGPTSVRRHEGICVAGAAPACGQTDEIADDCTDMLPANACAGTVAGGDLRWRHTAVGTCGPVGGMATCGSTQSTTDCDPRAPTCASGQLTRYTETCAAATGCGNSAQTPTTCPTSSPTCATTPAGAPARRTFTASCANGSTCSTTGTPTDTPCTAPGPSCTSGRLTTTTPTCASGTCGTSASTSTCPAGASQCLTFGMSQVYVTSAPDCDTATACDPDGEPTMTTCTDPADSCTGGTLTRVVPTCSTSTGCGTRTLAPTSCSDTASACTGSAAMNNLTLVTYTPACASGTDCGSPTRTDTACTTTQYTCDSNVFNYWQPTCNATTETCGRTNLRSVDCTQNTRTCEIVPGSRFYRVRVDTGTCSTTGGCGVSSTYEDCRRGSECISTTTLRSHSPLTCTAGQCGYADRACSDVYCDSNPDLYRNIFRETGCSGTSCTSTMGTCRVNEYCSDPDGRGGTPARCAILG